MRRMQNKTVRRRARKPGIYNSRSQTTDPTGMGVSGNSGFGAGEAARGSFLSCALQNPMASKCILIKTHFH